MDLLLQEQRLMLLYLDLLLRLESVGKKRNYTLFTLTFTAIDQEI